MSDERISEIKARVDAATEGPWEFWSNVGLQCTDHGRPIGKPLGPFHQGVKIDGANRTSTMEPDSVFIAHAREDIPYLLAEIERLSPPLAPVLEWEIDEYEHQWFAGDWSIRLYAGEFELYGNGADPLRDQPIADAIPTLEKAQLLASSIQRLLGETL